MSDVILGLFESERGDPLRSSCDVIEGDLPIPREGEIIHTPDGGGPFEVTDVVYDYPFPVRDADADPPRDSTPHVWIHCRPTDDVYEEGDADA